jgi:2,4-dichlorophenol 6-monooxygenase
VASSIEDQAAHFDRIGLDIGYVYPEGALVPEENERPPAEHQVTEYEPTTRPGARFPHVALGEGANTGSTHDLIGYDRYTLLIGAAGSDWNDALQRLKGSIETPVISVSLGEVSTEAGLEGIARLQAACEIEPEGALLIRPDGHVGWRHRNAPSDPDATLLAAFRILKID